MFNIEGGCYAKCIGLSAAAEPDIWRAIRYGAILENVVYDPVTSVVNYDSKWVPAGPCCWRSLGPAEGWLVWLRVACLCLLLPGIAPSLHQVPHACLMARLVPVLTRAPTRPRSEFTDNTRACYPIEHIDNARIPCVGPHPRNIILLCCDAFGVLPPVSKLTLEQAMYHFISGYTSKVGRGAVQVAGAGLLLCMTTCTATGPAACPWLRLACRCRSAPCAQFAAHHVLPLIM